MHSLGESERIELLRHAVDVRCLLNGGVPRVHDGRDSVGSGLRTLQIAMPHVRVTCDGRILYMGSGGRMNADLLEHDGGGHGGEVAKKWRFLCS